MKASKVNSDVNLKKIGSICLFVNGLIFLFYALFVPVFVHGVHWLITLAAVLLILALPAICHSLLQVHRGAAKIIATLLGIAMIAIIVSDLLFALSSLSGLNHDLAYASGNLLFVICLFAIGVITLRGVFFKWFGYLGILTAIIGLSTYVPQGPGVLSTVSLALLGLWSLAFGLNLSKLSK